jgi:hypothetical protein
VIDFCDIVYLLVIIQIMKGATYIYIKIIASLVSKEYSCTESRNNSLTNSKFNWESNMHN